MRILILANDGEGLYKFRKELLEALLKDNNEVFISLPRDKYISIMEDMGCKYIDTNFNRKGTNPIKDIKLVSFYKKIIKEIKPSVVLTYTIKPNVYGGIACQITSTPYIVNMTGLGAALEKKGILQQICIILYKLGLKGVKKVFLQNESNKEFMIQKGIIKENVCELVPGSGVNLSQYKLMEYPKDDTINFVYIGRMMEEKGYGLYLEAAKVLKEKYPNVEFHIAGMYEENYKKEETEELIKNNIVIYHGSVIDMVNEIYKVIHCNVMPTYYAEGMSNVLLESLACGRPIITTDRPGCKEIVEDGINGFIVKQKDLDDLINKMEKFINLNNSQRKQMGINGRKKVEKEFDRNIVVNKYLKVIKECE